jgi:predicted metalloprotease with PDZ domain
MNLRQIRLVFISALLLTATAQAQERPTKKCNSSAMECERAIRSMASGRRYLGALVEETNPGLRVASIIADSPAQRGGLGEGDRLMVINGRSLVRGDIKEFKRILSEAKETGRLSILVARSGILKKVDVWLAPYSKAQIDKMVAQHMAEQHSQAATTQPQP